MCTDRDPQTYATIDKIREQELEPAPNPVVSAWDRFASNANWSGLHVLDYERFAEFILQLRRFSGVQY